MAAAAAVALVLVAGAAWFTTAHLARAADARIDAAEATLVLQTVADEAQFPEKHVGALRTALDRLTGHRDQVRGLPAPALDAPFAGPADGTTGLEQRLIEHYWAAEDLAAARTASAGQAERLADLALLHDDGVQALIAGTDAVVVAVRSMADVGAAGGRQALAHHDRASEQSRAELSAAVEALENLALEDSAREDAALANVTAEPRADMFTAGTFTAYTAAERAVLASHEEVLAAEQAAEEERRAEEEAAQRAAAEKAAAEKAAADEAARKQARSGNDGGGGGGNEGGGGSRVCTYLGFGGTVQIKPCA